MNNSLSPEPFTFPFLRFALYFVTLQRVSYLVQSLGSQTQKTGAPER
jgi:hypothetical protein